MSFLKYIESCFDRCLAVDFEYRMDKTKTVPKKVVCATYKDVFTGETWNFWEHDRQSFHPHFDFHNNLYITFNAVAEVGCWLKLLHGVPTNVWDCMIEHRRLYNGRKDKFNLLSVGQDYGYLDELTKEQKQEERDLIINNETYTKGQRQRILNYNKKDVDLTAKIFLKQVADLEKQLNIKPEDYEDELWNCLFHGARQGGVAKVEAAGIPVDLKLLNEFNVWWPHVKADVIDSFNAKIDLFEDGKLKYEKFEKLIRRLGFLDTWPRNFKNNKLSMNKKTIEDRYSHIPELQLFLELQKLNRMTLLSGYNIGEDGRSRTSLFMFKTKTGRCAPSTALYPFNASKWARNFIKPAYGTKLFYLDYSQQEVAIQGALSKDENMLKAYSSGDVYVWTAKQCGRIPQHITNEEAKDEQGPYVETRDIFKQLFLANNYGAGIHWLKGQLKSTMYTARYWKKKFSQIYKTYFNWIRNEIDRGFITGCMNTRYGWSRIITSKFQKDKYGNFKPIKNSLQNWPIQSTGADILGMAMLDVQEQGFKVCGLVHDAILVELPLGEERKINEVQRIMELAAHKVIGIPIRVDCKEIIGNYKQKKKNQDLFDAIFKKIEEYKNKNKASPIWLEASPNR